MRKYVFGIQVETSKQLKSISKDIKEFMEEVGSGTAEIQVAVGGGEDEDMTIQGFTAEQLEEHGIEILEDGEVVLPEEESE